MQQVRPNSFCSRILVETCRKVYVVQIHFLLKSSKTVDATAQAVSIVSSIATKAEVGDDWRPETRIKATT